MNIKINSNPGYDIMLGKDTLTDLVVYLNQKKIKELYILTDENVFNIYQAKFENILNDFKVEIVIVPPGEQSKSFMTYHDVVNAFIEKGLKRYHTLLAIGGGVVGDLAGFVAATLYRGIDYIQIPTTLLSMVDSSIGGKTGINTDFGKNLVGAFHNPKAVFIDVNFLATLPNKEYKNGMAEIIKAAMIKDTVLLEKLESNNLSEIQMIKHAILVKKALIEIDPYDKNERMFLNFGHTFGHALEKVTDYTLPHGFAVAEGMIIAIEIGIKLNITQPNLLKRIHTILEKYDLGFEKPNKLDLIKHLTYDKKVTKDHIQMILLESEGNPIIKKVTEEILYGCYN